MRRFVFIALLCTLVSPAAFAFGLAGVLVPRDVYVGDEALLQVDFENAGGLPPGDISALVDLEPRATVRAAEIVKTPEGHRLLLRFVPWETGELSFPPLDLPGFSLNLAPVTIASLSEKLGAVTLRPPRAPALVPGTTYLLLALSLGALGGIALLVLVLRKAAALCRFLAERFRLLHLSAAGRRCLRGLKKAPNPDALEHLLRVYLETRFSEHFTACTTAELGTALHRIFGGAGGVFLEEQITTLHGIFLRCDYLRFASPEGEGDSKPGDSKAEQAALSERAMALVRNFEKGPPDEAEEIDAPL